MAVNFKILFWRNLKTEKRMLAHSCGEILVIILLGVLIIANPSKNSKSFIPTKEERSNVQIFSEDKISDLNILQKVYEDEEFPYSLAFEPNVPYAKNIAEDVALKLKLKATTHYVPNKFLAKLIFGDYKGDDMPKNFTLAIRFPGTFRTYKSSRVHSNLWLSRCTGSLINSMDDRIHELQTDLYIREGFLQLQHLTFMKWLSELNKGASSDFDIGVSSFRYPTKERLCQPNTSPNIFSLLYYFMFFLPFLNLIWKYARETEENMMAHHWRYGCSGFLYWSSHFLSSFLHFILLDIVVFLLTVISWETRPQPEYTDELSSIYLLGILLLTACELIICAMLIACLIPFAVNAIYLGILLWIFLYAVFSVILEYSVDVKSYWMIFSLVTMFNNDFVYCMRYLMKLDESTAANIGYLFATIAGSIILKLLLLVLVQYSKPGRYVQQRPFHYFGLRSMCSCCKAKECVPIRSKPTLQAQIASWENGQFGPLHGQKHVVVWQVEKSVKNFRQPKKGVLKKINMLIFKGEITVILGHYSSGKTTFAALLAGWQKPNEGIIEILEKNIHCDMTAMKLVDISMPNNALFDYLTAYETLKYFVTIKGDSQGREQSNDEIQKWLRSLKTLFRMGDEHNKIVRDMNFEQKRLLALCCVLCCGTKVVVLDEPTSHMRVAEQRLYWSILQREKADRSIIVTTTSFREAESIGDRIAVFTDGFIKAYGTSMFLKSVFGTGFDLIILKEKDAASGPITNFLKGFISDIILDNENHNQLIYKIPSDRRSIFQIMLIQLEKRYKDFGITDTRLLTTDLSEVYLSLGKTRDKPKIPDIPQALSVDFLPKKKRARQQWAALSFKKFRHQPSTSIPLFMCLSSIVLIIILTQLIDVFRDGGHAANSIVLGFDENHDRRLLRFMNNNCKMIGIRKVQMGNTLARAKSLSFTFVPGSFFCSKKSFKNYIRSSSDEMGHMYGAIEANSGTKFTVYVNQHILHSAPLALNLLHNYLLQKTFPSQYDKVARIKNDPIPIPTPHATGLLNSELEHLILPLAMGFIIPMTICTFIFPVVEERKTNILTLMSIAGLRIDIYWFVNFIWDWLTFFIYTIFFQVIIIILFYDELRINDSFLIFLIINVYSVPLLASIYFLSMLIQTSRIRAYAIACLFHFTSGLFSFVVFWDVLLAQPWYLYVFLFLPTFSMLDGVSNVFVMSRYLKKCTQLCKTLTNCDPKYICDSISECCEYSFFEWGNSGILRSIIFLLLSTIIIILLMIWVEIHQRESKFLTTPRIKQMYTKTYPYDDENIVKMRERIATADLRTIAKKRLVVDQVERRIPGNSMGLSTVSFDVDKQFCLAIYGTHRVGKSRICRQIVGKDDFHFGDIYIRGIPVKYNINDAWVYLGYTPQRLTIMSGFTVNEILHFFCLLRGVPKGAIPTVASDISSLFNLDRVKNRKIALLSKGTQRKINIAVALVATNKVIILDEPTRGLPQWTCREIWKALRYLCSCGKSIVIATTSMYECDAVADTVLVIDEQEMLAYGSSQYLRAKHIGFYLDIRLRRDGSTAEEVEENLRVDVDNLHRFMIFMHSESILVNRIDNSLKFYLPVEKINFNILYGSLERNRTRLNISDYTVSQGNFEEVLKSISAQREQGRQLS